ncbi:MAG: hypothetical protein IJH83_09280 [Coriobacteriales bacterium]|nr:hypothetical protein [Coriobacteriales bacterium]
MNSRILLMTASQNFDGIKAIPQGYEVTSVVATAPDYYAELHKADIAGFEIAIVDARGVTDVDAAENGVRRLLSTKRPVGARMRIIFIAPDSMSLRDLMFPRLIQVGVYDLIIPQAGHIVSRMLPTLIETPNTYSKVAPLNRGVEVASFNLGLAPAAKDSVPSADDLRALSFSGLRTIAVAGAKIRSGSTTAALALARSFRLAGFSVAVVVSGKEDFSAMKSLFPSQVNEDGALRIGISERLGIDFWHGIALADCNQRTQIVIFDHGVLDFIEPSQKVRERESWQRMEARRARWNTADFKVLVATTGMTDLAFLHDLLMNRSALELEKWNLFLNCCSPRMAETIAQGIHTAAPHCGVFRMPELPDPLALTQVPAFVDEFYAHISNGQHLEGKVRRG